MLRCHASLGIPQQLSGRLFGHPGGAQLPPGAFDDYDRPILQVVREEQGLVDLPVVTRHGLRPHRPDDRAALGRARIDPQNSTFDILESAVT